jgi:hypothetical protein
VAEDRQRNQGVFSGMVRVVSNAREGSQILTFLFGTLTSMKIGSPLGGA